MFILDAKAIAFHKSVAEHQRKLYNFMRKDKETLRNKLLIDLDFKMKIAIGMNPRQVGSEYYNQIMKSCLGKINFDFNYNILI